MPPPKAPDPILHFPQPGLNPWRELALLALVVMDLCWVVAWFRLLYWVSGEVSELRAFLVFGGVFLAAILLARLILFLSLKAKIRATLFVIFILLAAAVSLNGLYFFREADSLGEAIGGLARDLADLGPRLPGEFIVIVTVLLLCRQGVILAREGIEPAIVLGSFRAGLVMFLAYGGVTYLRLTPTADATLYLFLCASLVALSAARLGSLSHWRGGLRIPFDRSRLASLALFVLGLAGAALLAAQAAVIEPVYVFVAGVCWSVFRLLIALAALLFSPVILLLIVLFERIGRLVSASPLIDALQQLQEALSRLTDRAAQQDPTGQLLRLKPGVMAVIGIILLATTLFMLRNRFRLQPRRAGAGLELEMQDDLLNRLMAALRRQWQALADGLARVGLQWANPALAAARIRQVYADLLALSARFDAPRPEARTPHEFLSTLKGVFPTMPVELTCITDAYERVRYGELPEALDDVQAVEQAWRNIKTWAENHPPPDKAVLSQWR